MSFTDALSRISEIQQQIVALTDGALPTSSASSAAATGTDTATTDFAGALAQAQQPAAAVDSSAESATESTVAADNGVSGGAGLSSAAALPATASSEMTTGQRQFAATLSADTGLNPGVICAWLLSEENGSAAQSRQSANNNDWLNIGYTDSGTYGASDAIWSDPTRAANATAEWLKGQSAIPGYGTASGGVQSILATVGQSPQDQISALQNSGWASGGYPLLAQVYAQVTGG